MVVEVKTADKTPKIGRFDLYSIVNNYGFGAFERFTFLIVMFNRSECLYTAIKQFLRINTI